MIGAGGEGAKVPNPVESQTPPRYLSPRQEAPKHLKQQHRRRPRYTPPKRHFRFSLIIKNSDQFLLKKLVSERKEKKKEKI